MCNISQPESLCSKLWGSVSLLLSPGRDAHNQISQFTLPTFQLEKQLFSTSIFGLNSPFYHPSNFTLNTFFHREVGPDQIGLAFWFEVDEFIVILRPSQGF